MTYPPPYPYSPPPTTASGHGSLGVGIVALLICWVPFLGLVGLVLAVIGISLGARSFRLRALGYQADRGVALAGMIVSTIALAISGLFHAIIVWAMLSG